MRRVIAAALALLLLGSCARSDRKTHLYLQRFFGECGAEYGGSTDVAKAEGECGIITTLIDRFNAENPDIQVDVNVVAWPGYPQLTAQVAARATAEREKRKQCGGAAFHRTAVPAIARTICF